jgi:amino acid transporter
MNMGIIAFLIVVLVGGIILLLLITSIDRYTKFFEAFRWIYTSLKYAALGTGITAAFYALYLICGFLVSAGSGIDPMIFVWIIGGYVAMTLIGYTGVRIKTRIQEMHSLYKRKNDDITSGEREIK